MPSLSRAFYDRFILHNEGGYKPPHAADPETLFGVRLDNFAEMLKNLTAKQRDHLSPDVKRLVDNPRGLMRYIATKLEPSDNHGRTSEVPRTHNASDIQAVNAIKDIVFQYYQKKYCDTPGLNLFPQRIADLATDFSVHRGGAVALWTVERAMQEVGLVGGSKVTTADAVLGKQGFMKHGPEYLTHAKAETLAEKLSHASPQQLQLMEHYFTSWRRGYYKEQVRMEGAAAEKGGVEEKKLYSYHKHCLATWNARVDSMIDAPNLAKLAAQFEAEKALSRQANTTSAANSSQGSVPEQSLLGSIACAVTGYYCAPAAKPPRTR